MAHFACVMILGNSIKEAYPLPRMEKRFPFLHNAYCLLALDLLTGYHQIPVRAEARPKTAFLRHNGLYVFTVMQLALCKAAAKF